MTTQDTRNPQRDASTAELMARLSDQVGTLVRDELELATAELKRKGGQAGVGVGLSGAGVVLAWFGVAALVTAGVLGLAQAVPAWLAALIVGLALLLVAAVLTKVGVGRVKDAAPPVPQRAIQETRADVAAVKEGLHR
jgi:multisubunit Na+/H+ antiporter MnhC subunit